MHSSILQLDPAQQLESMKDLKCTISYTTHLLMKPHMHYMYKTVYKNFLYSLIPLSN